VKPATPLVLASASPRRLDLLRQVGVEPSLRLACEVDEAPLRGERPHMLARRLARAKAEAGAQASPGAFVLGADTVVACGRRILPKAETEAEASACLDLLSGRAHDVFTAVAALAPDGRLAERLAATRVRFKRLSAEELADYLAGGEWRGKAGGYAIQGRAGGFVTELSGSYSAVVGLPLHETLALLRGLGWRPQAAAATTERAP
jgi:septum formation protein